jgi:hypothetical protein
MTPTIDHSLACIAKTVRLWRKRNLAKITPRRPKVLVLLNADSGSPVVEQLRQIVADKKNALSMMDQLEIWNAKDKEKLVSRKEFRRGIAFLGFAAPKDDLNALFDEIDTNGSGEIDLHELETALLRIRSGAPPPTTTGKDARKAKLAAKAASAPKKSTDLRDARPRAIQLGAPPRVAPFRAAVSVLSPVVAKVTSALSPAVQRAAMSSISALSPAVAKVVQADHKLFSPTSAVRIEKWAQFARTEPSVSVQGGARLEKWVQGTLHVCRAA